MLGNIGRGFSARFSSDFFYTCWNVPGGTKIQLTRCVVPAPAL